MQKMCYRELVEAYQKLLGGAASETEAAKELIRTAYHEAGHFVVSEILGGRARSVTVVPSTEYMGRSGGGFDYSPIKDIVFALAGGLACEIGTGEADHGTDQDLESTLDIAELVAGEQDAQELVEEMRSLCMKILQHAEVWEKLCAVKERLMQEGTIFGKELDEFGIRSLGDSEQGFPASLVSLIKQVDEADDQSPRMWEL